MTLSIRLWNFACHICCDLWKDVNNTASLTFDDLLLGAGQACSLCRLLADTIKAFHRPGADLGRIKDIRLMHTRHLSLRWRGWEDRRTDVTIFIDSGKYDLPVTPASEQSGEDMRIRCSLTMDSST